MGIFLKLIFKNIKEKKMRTFLIIISITMSTALCFASISISDTMTKIFTDKVRKDFGATELVIEANDKSLSRFMSIKSVMPLKDEFKSIIGVVESRALYRSTRNNTTYFNLRGVGWDDLLKLNPVRLEKEVNLLPFEGCKIVISAAKAQKYNLKVGQDIKIQINEGWFSLTIVGISAPVGIFDGDMDVAVVPGDFLGAALGNKGGVSKIYLQLNDPMKKDDVIKKLCSIIKRYDIKETILEGTLKERTQIFTSVLSVLMLIIIVLSTFIIYVSFKVIVSERLPVLGTLRSIGASRKFTHIILLSESLIYGIVSGALGCFGGIGVLYLMAYITSEGSDVTISFSISQFPIALLMAILLSVFSSVLPILGVSRIPVKDVILNKMELAGKKRSIWRLMLGLVLLGISIYLPGNAPEELELIVIMSCMVLMLSAVILIIPYLIVLFMYMFKLIYVIIFGNVGVIAVKNLRNNKIILNNIFLLAIGIATVLTVITSGKSTILGIVDYTRDTYKYELTFSVPEADRGIVRQVKAVNGVIDAQGVYETINTEVKGYEEGIVLIEGVNPSSILNFKNIIIEGENSQSVIENLESGRNIILTCMLSNRYGLDKGDSIMLRLNNQYRDYKIIGLMDTMNVKGSYAIVSERNFTMDTGSAYYSSIIVKTNINPDEMLETLKNKFSRNSFSGITVEEDRDIIIESTGEIFTMMNGVSAIAVILGIFGIYNNLTISFIQRKRSLAVFRSMGMSRYQSVKMIIIEAISSGLIGGAAGVFAGIGMMGMVPHLTKAIIATIPIRYSVNTLIIAGLSGVLITIISSINSFIKTSRLNIIGTIKYE